MTNLLHVVHVLPVILCVTDSHVLLCFFRKLCVVKVILFACARAQMFHDIPSANCSDPQRKLLTVWECTVCFFIFLSVTVCFRIALLGLVAFETVVMGNGNGRISQRKYRNKKRTKYEWHYKLDYMNIFISNIYNVSRPALSNSSKQSSLNFIEYCSLFFLSLVCSSLYTCACGTGK